MLKSYTTLAAVGFSAAMLPATGFAANLDAQGLMNSLNLVVLGDADASAINHIEGTAYIGGDLNSGTIYANNRGMDEVTVGDVTGGLIVGGDINATVNGGGQGAIVVGGTINGGNGSGLPTTTGAVVPVAEMATLFTELSSNLATLDTTAGATFDTAMNFQSLTSGAGDEDGIAVLNLSQTDALDLMSNGGQLRFNLDTDVTSYIVNVAGTDFTGANAINIQTNNAQPNVLFNFYEAQSLTTNSTWNASILAPEAAYFNGSGENGTYVVGSLIMGGEIRPYNGNTVFSGTLPTFATETAAPVPVPAALPLAATGLALLGFVGRRRKAA